MGTQRSSLIHTGSGDHGSCPQAAADARRIDGAPQTPQSAAKRPEGHTVGNHTYDHADMTDLSLGRMRNELRSTQEAVDGATGYHHPMALMRPPYVNPYLEGSIALPAFREVVQEQELVPVMWTVDPGGYLLGDNPDGVVQTVARADEVGRKGAADEILLLHDNQ